VEVAVQVITALTALAALAVSIVVAKRQTDIQARLAAIDEARRAEELEVRTWAQITVSLRMRMPPLLLLRNHGPAVARGLDLEVPQGPGIPPVIGLEEVFPADLQPDQEMAFAVSAMREDDPVLRVTVRWADGAGDHEELFVLTIPN
jgi:hypothetical protein